MSRHDGSGIQSIRRLEALDLDGRTVGVLLGYTDGGEVALGIAGSNGDEIVLLDSAAQAEFMRKFREVTRDASGGA